jgi:hypothetical protein
MNEIQLIRGQLSAESTRAAAVAQACLHALEHETVKTRAAAPVPEFRNACVEYLVRVLAAFDERDQRLGDLLRAQPTGDDVPRRALESALALQGCGREALEKLESAYREQAVAPAQHAWRAFVQYLQEVWKARRDRIDQLLAANNRVTDWRAIGGIDADSMLQERRGYARVCALLPARVMLPPLAALAALEE